MDDIVEQAMHKWPNVPNCFGWLGLDARGNWYMRDEVAQTAGVFGSAEAAAKGSLLQHHKLMEFIGRNYASDAQGRWYFQNGPQRVFVELEATPWVWRISRDFAVSSHTGITAQPQQALVDENGWLYLMTSTGFGLVHTQDVGYAADAIDQGLWKIEAVQRCDLPKRFGFVKNPASP